MDQKILDFLPKEHVCSLTTLLPDGSPHAAALHFSHQADPFKLYFSTENTSRKCKALLDGKSSKAAVVVGLSEEEWITFQIDGDVRAITESGELKVAKSVHYAKNPGSQKFENDPATLFLEFTPSWWRFTDFNTKPPTIISSEK